MFSPTSPANVPGTRLHGELFFKQTFSSASRAFALNSQQRMISMDLLHTVVRLLRSVGPLLEASALQEAMQDADASEFVTAAMHHEVNDASSDSAFTNNVSAAPSVSFLPADVSAAHSSSRLSASDATPDTMKLAAVLRTHNAASASVPHSTREDIGRVSSTATGPATPLSDTAMSTSVPRKSPPSVVPHTPESTSALARSHDAPTTLPPHDHNPSASRAKASGGGGGEGFRFPPDWFDTAAVGRLARRHPIMQSSAVDWCEHRVELSPPFAPSPPSPHRRQGGHDTAAATAPPSASGSTASFASFPDSGPSQSMPTAAFCAVDTPLAIPATGRAHVSPATAPAAGVAAAASHAVSSRSTSLPHASATSARGILDDYTTIITAQPPLYIDGMLLDPASGRFLFGGHAFREEARVLYVPSTVPLPPSAWNSQANASTSIAAAAAVLAGAQERKTGGLSATMGPPSGTSRTDAACLLLLREYFPVSPVLAPGNGGDGGVELMSFNATAESADDIVIRSFSLLPPWLTQVAPNRYHLLSDAATVACVCQATPGCLTAVTSLSRFLHGGRNSSFTINSHGWDPTGPFAVTAPALGGMLGARGGHKAVSESTQKSPDAERAMLLNYRHMDDSTSYGADGPRLSLAQSISAAAPRTTHQPELEAARIVAVAERLSAVPPDVLDDALAAVRHCLTFYHVYTERKQRIRDVLAAVRMVQRFFRRCLAIKRRAVRRMMRVWRKLEAEARLKLQQHRAPPSAVERIDAVANTILQDHMLTPSDYKRAFIGDEWARRRAAFNRWKEEEEWIDLFAEERPMHVVEGGAYGRVSTANDGCRPRSARLTPEEEQYMVDAFARRRRASTQPWRTAPLPSSIIAAGVAAVKAASSPLLSEVKAARHQAALRRFRSWYMDPYELLYLSHQRLLQTLKGTVLRLEEVQSELDRAAAEVARDAAAHATTKM